MRNKKVDSKGIFLEIGEILFPREIFNQKLRGNWENQPFGGKKFWARRKYILILGRGNTTFSRKRGFPKYKKLGQS